MSEIEQLTALLVDMDEDGVLAGVKDHLEAGDKAQDILEALSEGMDIVGEKYGAKEYFLADLVMAAEIFKESMEMLEPALGAEGGTGREVCGKMVIGTVKGDLHDIGKNIFVALARNAGFAVSDLGIDVSPEALIAQVKKDQANVLGLSGILTFSLDAMAKTVELLTEAGLRDEVKVIIGGLPVDERCCELAGADAYSDDAYEGLQKLMALLEVN
jgi:methylmalonyl-CoA mutase cobalamin-binding domain/chain